MNACALLPVTTKYMHSTSSESRSPISVNKTCLVSSCTECASVSLWTGFSRLESSLRLADGSAEGPAQCPAARQHARARCKGRNLGRACRGGRDARRAVGSLRSRSGRSFCQLDRQSASCPAAARPDNLSATHPGRVPSLGVQLFGSGKLCRDVSKTVMSH